MPSWLVVMYQAQRQPSDNNTLFYQGASSAFAIPPLTSTPNGSTPETLHHYVLKPDSTQGWSVYDSMLLVPVGQLMREAARHSDQPLLYLGHPLGLVSSTERHKRGDTHDHGGAETAKAQSARALRWHGSPKRRPLSQEKHMYTVQDLDDSLAEYVKKMTESDCGLTKVSFAHTQAHTAWWGKACTCLLKDLEFRHLSTLLLCRLVCNVDLHL